MKNNWSCSFSKGLGNGEGAASFVQLFRLLMKSKQSILSYGTAVNLLRLRNFTEHFNFLHCIMREGKFHHQTISGSTVCCWVSPQIHKFVILFCRHVHIYVVYMHTIHDHHCTNILMIISLSWKFICTANWEVVLPKQTSLINWEIVTNSSYSSWCCCWRPSA